MNSEPVPLRVLIVDDEEPARRLLREYLKNHPEWVVVGEAQNGLEAVQRARDLKPHLLLLDVQMPKLDGFEVLGLLDPGISVVFTTAFDQHALRAFEVHAVDYLLKPFSPERFSEALTRTASRLEIARRKNDVRPLEKGETSTNTERLDNAPSAVSRDLARAARPPGTFLERLVFRDGAEVNIVPVTKIECLQSQDDYVEAFFGKGSALTHATLQSLEESLDPKHFVRVHRSWVINLDHLTRVEPWGQGRKMAILTSGRSVPVSRTGDARLKGVLG